MSRTHWGVAAACAAMLTWAATAAAPPATRPASRPASAPASAGRQPFQPGVLIDWQRGEVVVEAVVVLRDDPLEYAACFGSKEHESLARLEATAQHVYLALGLIGLQPGTPLRFEGDEIIPPTGALVDVLFEWEAAGQVRTADPFAWMRELEFGRRPPPRPFVFAGSLPLPGGRLAADQTGEGLALVNAPAALLAFPATRSDRDSDLWAICAPDEIPPLGTRVRVILRAAAPVQVAARLDALGQLTVNGALADAADLREWLDLLRRQRPDAVLTISVDPRALEADVRALAARLRTARTPASAVSFARESGQ